MSSSDTRSAARFVAPLLMVVLTGLFVALVVHQLNQNSSEEASRDPESDPSVPAPIESVRNISPEPALGTGGSETEAEPVAVQESAAVAAMRSEVQSYMEFLRFDPDHYRDEGPKIAYKRQEFEEFLAGLPPEAVPMLLDLMNAELMDPEGDFGLRRFLIYGIAAIGSDESTFGLADYYHTLTSLPDGKESEVGHTIKAIGKIDTPASFEMLNDFVDGGGKRAHKHRFVREMGNHTLRESAVPLFTDLMVSDEYFKVRNNAAQALKKTASPRTVEDIERAVVGESNYVVKQTMMGALGSIGDPRSLGTLEQVVRNDPDPVTRTSAIYAIRRVGGPDAKRVLRDVVEKDSSERVRQDARRAIVELEEDGF